MYTVSGQDRKCGKRIEGSPPSLRFRPRPASLTRNQLIRARQSGFLPVLHDSHTDGELVHLLRDARDDGSDGGREPVLERKRLAPVTTDEAVLGQLEEAQVRPADGETELDEHVGRRGEHEREDVGQEEVNPGQRLRVSRYISWFL